MPVFSVVIPLYNKENFITDTLHSVLAQTFTGFEVIIVNDVSTDNSLAVAKDVEDNRIRIIDHPVNKGLSASRNTGIKNAAAPFVAFLDADDIWKPQFLEKIHELITNYPEAGLFATKYEEIYPGDIIIEHPFNLKTGLIDNFFKASLKQPIYCPSALCVKKTAFSKTGDYDEQITLGEDIDFNIRAHMQCKIAYYNEPLVRYTMQSENQITRDSLDNKIITDFDKYEKSTERKDVKVYLDFNRYIMAKQYKVSGNNKKYREMIDGLKLGNLNYKQIILLYMPVFILKFIKGIKTKLIKKGLNPTSY